MEAKGGQIGIGVEVNEHELQANFVGMIVILNTVSTLDWRSHWLY